MSLATRTDKIAWLRAHPELWRDRYMTDKLERTIAQALKAAGLVARTTLDTDARVPAMVEAARRWDKMGPLARAIATRTYAAFIRQRRLEAALRAPAKRDHRWQAAAPGKAPGTPPEPRQQAVAGAAAGSTTWPQQLGPKDRFWQVGGSGDAQEELP